MLGKNIIAFTGFPMSGKTTIAKALANTFKLIFIDLDLALCRKFGVTITELLSSIGVDNFRIEEQNCLLDLLEEHRNQNVILSLGGGCGCSKENLTILTANTTLIHLRAPFSLILRRRQRANMANRPLIANMNNSELKNLYDQRQFYYNQADAIVDITHHKSKKAVVKEVGEICKLAVSPA